MTAPRNPDWLIRSFLEEGQTDLPDPVYDQVRGKIEHTRQRVVIGTWTAPDLHLFGQLAMAAAAVVVVAAVAVVGINLLPSFSLAGGPSASASPSPSAPPPDSSPSPQGGVRYYFGDLTIGRHPVTVDGVAFSFSVPHYSWEWGPIHYDPGAGEGTHGSLFISKSTVLSQGAEAVIFWTSFPGGADADPCASLLSPTLGPSVDDLAAAVATASGTDLVTGPSDVSVGGRAGKHIVLAVREDLGCDPGYFYSWQAEPFGAVWGGTDVGDTIRVWIVDVNGTSLFIAAETKPSAGPAVELEIQQIVDSIQFE